MNIKQHFKKFLKDNDVYYMYWVNSFHDPFVWPIEKPENYITHAFIWLKAKYKKGEFWDKIDNNWQEYLETLKDAK